MNIRIEKIVSVTLVLALGPVLANATPKFNLMNGHYYEVISAPNITWTAAEAAASGMTLFGEAGHLVTITSAAENQFLVDNFNLVGLPYWLGGRQDPSGAEPSGGWGWITDEVWGYTNWAGGEPNNAGGEDALALAFFAAAGTWNDAPVGHTGYNNGGYIVEYDLDLTPEALDDDLGAFVPVDPLTDVCIPDPELPIEVSGTCRLPFTNELVPIDIALLLDNDTPGDEPNTVTLVSGTTTEGGEVSISGNIIEYKSAPGVGGTDSFEYTLTDYNGDSDTATVTITIEASVAVAEPDPGNPEAPVTVFQSSVDNPFDFLYQEIPPGGGGMVTADCCTFQDYRETAGNGRGRNLFFKPRKLDIGKALRKSVVGTNPFDSNCAALIPFVPIGAAIASPWQRIAPDPDSGNPPRYGDRDYVESLVGAFCVIQSDVFSDGIALTSENPEPLVGYDNNCDEDDRDFRPVTGTISLDPSDKDAPYIQTSTAECDRARNARRSSTVGYWINMRNTSLGRIGQLPQVLGMLGSLKREIRAEKRFPSCSPAIPTAHLNALKKQLFRATLNVIIWSWNPQKIRDRALPELDALTLLALDTPSCSTNFKGLVTGRSMAATFATCSYLGHPNIFDADKVGSDDHCLINPAILDEILGTTP